MHSTLLYYSASNYVAPIDISVPVTICVIYMLVRNEAVLAFNFSLPQIMALLTADYCWQVRLRRHQLRAEGDGAGAVPRLPGEALHEQDGQEGGQAVQGPGHRQALAQGDSSIGEVLPWVMQ
jgi:hypothetical protein